MTRHVRSVVEGDGSILYFVLDPQVHVHYVTTDAEADAIGASVIVVGCHGCGQSMRILFKLPEDPQPGGLPTLTRVRNDFRFKHRGCPNFDYHRRCRSFDKRDQTVVDLRGHNLNQG
jgi:hypothetical protein